MTFTAMVSRSLLLRACKSIALQIEGCEMARKSTSPKRMAQLEAFIADQRKLLEDLKEAEREGLESKSPKVKLGRKAKK